jgi:hypothetical protein
MLIGKITLNIALTNTLTNFESRLIIYNLIPDIPPILSAELITMITRLKYLTVFDFANSQSIATQDSNVLSVLEQSYKHMRY